MSEARHVDIFRDGLDQAVRIPHDFELPGKGALIRKVGDTLVIEPDHSSGAPARDRLLEALAQMVAIDEDFPEIEDSPPRPVNL